MPGQRQTAGRISSLSSWNSTLEPNVKPRKPVKNLHKARDECKQSEQQPRWAFHSPSVVVSQPSSLTSLPAHLAKSHGVPRGSVRCKGPASGGPISVRL